jgi:hypothetical protein
MRELIWPGFYDDSTDVTGIRKITPSHNLSGFLYSLSGESAQDIARLTGAQVGSVLSEIIDPELREHSAEFAIMGSITLSNIGNGLIAKRYLDALLDGLVVRKEQLEEVVS